MAAVVDLFAWAAAREQAAVEAILAELNHQTEAENRRARAAASRAARDINFKCHTWPEPEAVARLVVSHGVDAARERWGHVSHDELESLAARGGVRELRA